MQGKTLRSGCLVGLIVALLLSSATQAERRKLVYVDDVNGNDAWDGLCEEWDGGTCGPKATIQAGIDVAETGDEVLVADGVYTGSGNRLIQYLGKAITVGSKNGPIDCIIDIQNNETTAFLFDHGEWITSVLDGFTITNCKAC